ncbi:stemmadenine O-acetyltransferase [Andrographis paniculata]|uniref:stemmadenine O-acetyltransferase n=1 Tax=Andrographis paniculata TaxID=175694 RepID=UPI0021E8F590|nr:stemmadenine O-acetyltransferase [Andrographis paniculata]
MEIEIQILGKERVKPLLSSSTPKPPHQYQLSFLDQIAPPVLMPLVYFYPPTPTAVPDGQKSADKFDRLKKSLSEALSIFYPLAGRLVDDKYVDCTDDQGVPFVEAQANCDLSHLVTNLIPANMNKLLPYALDDVQNLGMAMAAQVTNLQCGGMAVAVMVSHKIADAVSFLRFANTWAALSSRSKGQGRSLPCDDVANMPRPKFQAAELFPPRDVAGFNAGVGIVRGEDQQLVAKVFTFPRDRISALRDRYSSSGSSGGGVPTRVEALSALIWTRFVSATGMKHDPTKIYTVVYAVNLRNRTEPPLSEDHFGNISRIAMAMPRVEDGGAELLKKVGEAIRGVNGDYVAMLQEGERHLDLMKERMTQAYSGELVAFSFTSLCRFPLYDADFGWGKPVRVASAPWIYRNLVVFMDTPAGDGGVEAWINLTKEDMDKFEADSELRDFISCT